MEDVARLKALDGDTWSRIEREYFQRIFFYVRRFVADFQRAEDLTQETFLAAIRAIQSYDPAYNMEQYIFGIAHNKVIDHLRQQGRSPIVFGAAGEDEDRADFFQEIAGGPGTPSQILVGDEDYLRRRKILIEALRALVEEHWQKGEFQKLKAVELVFLKRFKHARIAALLGIADEKAIAGIKFRAIRSLKQRLRDRDPNRTLFEDLWKEA
ncbi:MAG: sigma-70 family RNA polymerase sigma factor [Planctomycetes bacterium]|nr:sigma-70 family RNA polymerase sigma factor [Planctomycetota bacterium]